MKFDFYKIFILFIFVLFSGGVMAQEHTVSGIITDAESGLGIPGATIVEKGTTNGSITGIDGDYTLTVSSPDAVIVISFVGYTTEEIPLQGKTTVNLAMMVANTELEEFVVVGYGVQKKKVVTGAIASIDAEEINSTSNLRVEQAMQGRTAGVQITQLSGQPGETPTVRIRGAGTTGTADPLYIVDGMAVGGIDYLNPGDIESIDVLKDAASAAIYGARAANGVVLITTKSGGEGDMKLTYSAYYGIQNVTNTIDMLNAEDYMIYQNEGARNANQPEPFDLNQIPQYDTDWQDIMFVQNAPVTNHELSITGGNEKSSFSSSLSYFSQQGIIGGEKSQFERITARLNSKHKVNDRLTFGNSLTYSSINSRGIGSNESFNGVYSSALNLDPLTPLYEEDQDVLANYYPYNLEPVITNANGQVYGISELVGAEVVNPMALLEIQTAKNKTDKIVGNVFAELEIIDGLKLRTSAGLDFAYVNGGSYKPIYFLNGAQNNTEKTSVSKNIDRYYTWQWENTLTYAKTINNHTFSALLGTTASEYRYDNLTGFNTIVPTYDPENVYLNMATDTAWEAKGGAAHSALLSQFARVTYDYKSRYAFTGIIRRDGSSKFGANNRYGYFPSMGVTWLMTEEPFMPDLGPVEFIKLRGSWGVNGNQEIGNYRYISTIDQSSGYIFAGGRIVGASPAYVENPDIMWEESEQIDIAIDMGAFNNRLTATIDYYIKNTKGLLEEIPIPAHVGNNPPVSNVGKVRNSGVEMSVNWRHYLDELRYSFGVNASYNKNEMTYIGNAEKKLDGASWSVFGVITRGLEGLPIGYFYGYETDGIFQNQAEVYQHIGSTGQVLQPQAKPGDVRFVDVNGDGVINPDDRTMIGNPTPDWTLGMNGSLEYKNFDFTFLFTGAFGHEIFNGSQRHDLSFTNTTQYRFDTRWVGEGTSTTTPRYTWSDVNNNYRVSDLYIESGSYLRLKNLQIGYTLPQNFLKKIGSSSWRFYISGENVFTFTNYTGADPEIGAMDAFNIGIDRGIYPLARTIRFGTSITF